MPSHFHSDRIGPHIRNDEPDGKEDVSGQVEPLEPSPVTLVASQLPSLPTELCDGAHGQALLLFSSPLTAPGHERKQPAVSKLGSAFVETGLSYCCFIKRQAEDLLECKEPGGL